MTWLIQNLATILVSVLLIVIVASILRYLHKSKKKGLCTGCGGGCSGCSHCSSEGTNK